MKKPYLWFGYVYLFQCRGLYKIGFSFYPDKRLRSLQTGSAHPIRLVHVIRTPLFRQIEKALHRRFSGRRVRREWFELDHRDIAYIRSLDSHGRTPEERAEHQRENAELVRARGASRRSEDIDLNAVMGKVASDLGFAAN